MSYMDGFVIAVPSASKEAFVRHAETVDPTLIFGGFTPVATLEK